MFASGGATMVGVYVNSSTPVECVCNTCDATVWPRHNGIQQGRGTCPGCADHGGFDATKPGYLYLTQDLTAQTVLQKVGITNNAVEARLNQHGFDDLIDVMYSENGYAIRALESALKEGLRDYGDLSMGTDAGIAWRDGYTEAWNREDFDAQSLLAVSLKAGVDLRRDHPEVSSPDARPQPSQT